MVLVTPEGELMTLLFAPSQIPLYLASYRVYSAFTHSYRPRAVKIALLG